MPTANFKQNTPSGRVLRKREATMQKAMQGKDFKIIRRNSLTAEVDGVWPNLEEEEDSYIPHKVMMKECMMLRRVLGTDKADSLPQACKMNATSQANKNFITRLSHLNETSDVAGRVDITECHKLHDSLRMVAGGMTFLPASCNAMLEKEEQTLKERFEEENAKVYARLKRRNSWVGKEDYPPSAT